MSDSSESSPAKRANRSKSEEKQVVNKLFITNLDGKVLLSPLSLTLVNLRPNSALSFKSAAPLNLSLSSAIGTPSTVLPLWT